MAYVLSTDKGAEETVALGRESTWGDVWNNLVAGAHDMGAWVGAGLRAAGEEGVFDDEAMRTWAIETGTIMQNGFSRLGNERTDLLTPAAKQSFYAGINSPEFWKAPFEATLLKTARTAPTIGGAAAIGILTPAKPLAATMMAAAFGGGMTIAQSVDEMYKHTDSMSDKELMDVENGGSALYKQLRDDGMSEKVAREEFNKIYRGNAPAYLFALGAATTAFGAAGIAVRGLKGGAASALVGKEAGLLKRVGGATLEGAGSEFVEESGQDIASQFGAIEVGLQDEYDPLRTLYAGAEGALVGAPLGAAAGVVQRRRAEPDAGEDTTDAENQPENANQAPITGRTGVQVAPASGVPVGNPQSQPSVNKRKPSDVKKSARTTKPPSKKQAKVNENLTGLLVDPAQAAAMGGVPSANVGRPLDEQGVIDNLTQGATPQQGFAIPPAAPVEQMVAEQTRRPQAVPIPVSTAPQAAAPAQVASEGFYPPQPEAIPAPAQVASEGFYPAQPKPPLAAFTPAAQEPSVAPVAPEVVPPTTTVPVERKGERRVLPDLTKEKTAQVTDKQARENLEAAEPKEVQPKHRDEKEIAKRKEDNAKAAKIIVQEPHVPDEKVERHWAGNPKEAKTLGARTAIVRRAQGMVKAAEESNTYIPRQWRANANPEMNRLEAAMLLSEAKALMTRLAKVAKIKNDDKREAAAREAFQRFDTSERLLRAGDLEGYIESRKVEGEANARVGQGNVEERAAKQTAATEEEAAATEGKDEADEGGEADVDTEAEETFEPDFQTKKDESGEEIQTDLSEHKESFTKTAQAADMEDKGASRTEYGRKAHTIKARETKREVRQKSGKVVTETVAEAADKGRSAETDKDLQALKAKLNAELARQAPKAKPKAEKVKETSRKRSSRQKKADLDADARKILRENPEHIAGANVDEDPIVRAIRRRRELPLGVEELYDDWTLGHLSTWQFKRELKKHGWTVNLRNKNWVEFYDPNGNEYVHPEIISDKERARRAKAEITRGIYLDTEPLISNTAGPRLHTVEDYLEQPKVDTQVEGIEGFTPYATMTLGDVAEKMQREAKRKPTLLNRLYALLSRKAAEILHKDFRIYVAPDEWLQKYGKLHGANVRPFAVSISNFRLKGEGLIVVSEDVLGYPQRVQAHVLLHEIVHAITVRRLQRSANARKAVTLLMERARPIIEAAAKADPSLLYSLTHVDEFVAEGLANPSLQKLLLSIHLTPNEARLLGLKTWERVTLWDSFVNFLWQALGINKQYYTVFEGLVSVTEQLTHYHDPKAQLRFQQRLKDISYKEQLKAIKDAKRTETDAIISEFGPINVVGFRNEMADSSAAFADKAQSIWVKVLTFRQLALEYKNTVFGGPLDKLTKALDAQYPEQARYKKQYDTLAAKFINWSKNNTAMAREFADIALSLVNLDLRVVKGATKDNILDHPANDLGVDRRNRWQAKAQLPRLQDRFNNMSNEAQDLLIEMAEFYSARHNELVEQSVHSLLRFTPEGKFTDAEIMGFAYRTLEGKLTQDDKEALGVQLFNFLSREAAFKKVKGMYFPRMRYGDYVVVTKDKITDMMGGRAGEVDGDVIFEADSDKVARDQVRAFVEAQPFFERKTVTRQLVDPATGDVLTADEAKSYNDLTYRYTAHMQLEGAYFFESFRAAHRFFKDNPEGHADIQAPAERLGEGFRPANLTGSQVESLLKSVDARTDLTKEQKALLRTAIGQASARLLHGNRITSRRLKARKVTGASHDFARNIMQYGEAASRHLSTARSMPVVREALKEMKAARNNYEGKDKATLDRLTNEVTRRVEDGIMEPNAPGTFIQNVLTLSFLARLFSPGYSVVNSTQVMMMAQPWLAARHSLVRAVTQIGKSYAAIGAGPVALQGIYNTARAGKQWNDAGLEGLFDPLGYVKKRIAKQDKWGADRLRNIEEQVNRNRISESAGFEISEAITQGSGMTGSVMAKLDRMARQLPVAIEVINRSVTADAAYVLGREDGMTHEEAVNYADQAVHDTQGDYTAHNAPRFFNNPILRPAVQFKKFAQLYLYFFFSAVKHSFDGAKKEERNIARKQVMHMLATQTMFAGLLGLPGLEIAKLGFMVSASLGLSGNWEEQEDWLKDIARESFGKTAGDMLTQGTVFRAVGIDMHQRLSGADLALFGEPSRGTKESTESYILRQLGGSPGTLALDAWDGLRNVAAGDFWGGAGKIIPIKSIADGIKAANRYRKGEADLPTAIVNTLGLRTTKQSDEQEKTGRAIRGYQKQDETMRKLYKELKATPDPADREDLYKRIDEHNAKASHRYWVSKQYGLPESERQSRRRRDRRGEAPRAPRAPEDYTKTSVLEERAAAQEKRIAELQGTVNRLVHVVANTPKAQPNGGAAGKQIRVVRDPETGLVSRLEEVKTA